MGVLFRKRRNPFNNSALDSLNYRVRVRLASHLVSSVCLNCSASEPSSCKIYNVGSKDSLSPKTYLEPLLPRIQISCTRPSNIRATPA